MYCEIEINLRQIWNQTKHFTHSVNIGKKMKYCKQYYKRET